MTRPAGSTYQQPNAHFPDHECVLGALKMLVEQILTKIFIHMFQDLYNLFLFYASEHLHTFAQPLSTPYIRMKMAASRTSGCDRCEPGMAKIGHIFVTTLQARPGD